MLLVRPWKACDEVHVYYLPLSFRKIYIVSQTYRPLAFHFNLLDFWAFGNKLTNIFLDALPHIYLYQIAVHLGGTHMNGISRDMSFLHDPFMEFIHPRYTQPTLKVQHIISPLLKNQYSYENSPSNQAKWSLGLAFL